MIDLLKSKIAKEHINKRKKERKKERKILKIKINREQLNETKIK